MASSSLNIQELGLWSQIGRPEVMSEFHAHFEVEVNYLFSGRILYFMGSQHVEVPPERLAFFWGASPHRLISTAPGTECAWFTLPISVLLEWQLPAALLDRLFEGQAVIEPAAWTSPERVRRWVAETQAKKPIGLRSVLLEMEAALLRLGSEDEIRSPALVEDSGPVIKVCRFVLEHLSEPLTSEKIARSVGLHPNYLMRLFKNLTGMTLNEYITQQRLAYSQRLLLGSDLSVEEVGRQSGFQSPSQYFATFKAQIGLTPLKYRKNRGHIPNIQVL